MSFPGLVLGAPCGCGSKLCTQNGTLPNGTKHSNLRSPSCLILTNTHVSTKKQSLHPPRCGAPIGVCSFQGTNGASHLLHSGLPGLKAQPRNLPKLESLRVVFVFFFFFFFPLQHNAVIELLNAPPKRKAPPNPPASPPATSLPNPPLPPRHFFACAFPSSRAPGQAKRKLHPWRPSAKRFRGRDSVVRRMELVSPIRGGGLFFQPKGGIPRTTRTHIHVKIFRQAHLRSPNVLCWMHVSHEQPLQSRCVLFAALRQKARSFHAKKVPTTSPQLGI